MNHLKPGSYYGEHKNILTLNGLFITETDYIHDFVNWHYHENAYFTFLLRGKLTETNRKESYQLTPGSLLFHQWQDPHYNVKEPENSRGFHIEVSPGWLYQNCLKSDALQGSFQLKHPTLKLLIEKIYRETKMFDETSGLNIQFLLLKVFAEMQHHTQLTGVGTPKWVDVVRQISHDEVENSLLTLHYIARQANIHPVHLSREFPRYFHCSYGDYVRSIKVQRSLHLLRKSCLSIKSIALACGFANESHFIKLFQKEMGTSPTGYRKSVGVVKNIQLS